MKLKRWFMALLVAVLILLPCVASVSAAEDFELQYTLRSTTDLSYTYAVVSGYTGTMPERLVIPEKLGGYPVAGFEGSRFLDAPLKELILPGTIKEFNTPTFEGNRNLESVTIGEGTTRIAYAFERCANLKQVQLPSTLKVLGTEAFSLTALTAVELPAGLEEIGDDCFYYCKLRSITLPEGLKRIGESAFCGNRLKGKVVIPESVTELGRSAFFSNKLTEVVIPSDKIRMDYAIGFDPYTRVYAHQCTFEDIDMPFLRNYGLIAFEELPYDYFTQTVEREGSLLYVTVDGVAYVVSCDGSGTVTVPETLGGCPVRELLPNAFRSIAAGTKVILPDCVERIDRNCFGTSAVSMERLPKSLKFIDACAFYLMSTKTPSRTAPSPMG